MFQNERYLDLLSTFHYVVGGLAIFFGLFPLLHVTMGLLMLTGAFEAEDGEKMPAMIVATMFVVLPTIGIALMMTLAGLLFRAAGFLKRRVRHKFCMVVAGISCVFIPFGTVLGVLTIILLSNSEVEALFGRVDGGSHLPAE